MIDTLKKWYRRHLGREESVTLVALLIGSAVLLGVMGEVLTPVFIALIFAYLMQGVADQFGKWGVNQGLALAGSSLVFVGVFLGFTLGIAPLVWRQLESLVREAPAMMAAVQKQIEELIAQYPIVIEQAPITEMLTSMQGQAASLGQAIVGFGLSSIPAVLTFAI